MARRHFVTVLFSAGILAISCARLVRAETLFSHLNTGQIEVLQAEASLAYHTKKYSEAENRLQKILISTQKGAKNQIDAMELLALVYRQTQDEHKAAGMYRRLIEATPSTQHGPYKFELATIRFKQKKYAEARELFTASAAANFNPGTSTFFLGLLDLESKDYRMALSNFSNATSFDDAGILMPAIYFYLGNTYLMLGKTESAIRNFKKVESKENAHPLAKQALDGSAKAIQSLDRAQTFANIGLQTQWDSNVQSNPQEITNSAGLSNQRSIKSVISASIAHSTSPLRDWQFTPLYSFYGNYNYNKPTRAYNFASNTAGIYIFYQPYARLNKGFKAQTTLSMKNSPVRTGETLYTKYSLTEEIGPTFKYELSPRVFLGFDLFWKPKHFYGEAETGSTVRSGGGAYGRATIEAITTSALLNPQGYLAYESDATNGTQYDMTAWSLGAANVFQLSSKQSLRLSADVSLSNYPTSTPISRDDKNYNARALYSYLINSKWSWNLDYSYMINRSNIPSSYSYRRMLGSFGINYNF